MVFYVFLIWSNSASPPQLTGKIRVTEQYQTALLRVAIQGQVIVGATAISQTRALPPIEPYFEQYRNDKYGYRKVNDYSYMKIWVGNEHENNNQPENDNQPNNNNQPESICDVFDIYLESDYPVDEVEPKLAVICVSSIYEEWTFKRA